MRRIGRYELGRLLGRLLGRGGAGEVYEAELRGPTGYTKQVALKLLHGGSDELRREARIGGLLRHQHLVDVYEIGEADGTWFCALELCRGGRLSDRLPLSPRAVVEVGLQVCGALAYAHRELGLVHLDLKPDNLLVSEDGIKVADLGIAHAAGFAGDGRIRGTPGYMAPEQARGGAVDGRADIYALGVTLVELATGARPGASGTVDWSDDVDWTTGLDLAEPAPAEPNDVPAWLAPAVDRCLAADPADRWPDMAELARALAGLEAPGPGVREELGLARPTAVQRTGTTNLGPAAPLAGRRAELAHLADELAKPGAITLKGPPGIGKTRLAVEAARAWHDAGQGGAWLCDLTEARTLDGVLFGVAAALELALPRGSSEALALQLGHAIAARGPIVLVLDTVEHPPDLAATVASWCTRAAEARVIVTSRGSPRIPGERRLEVGPLAVADAVDLLVAHGRARGVELRPHPDLDRLAEALDGVPLALELAAGRLGVLSVREVIDRLGLSLLRRGTEDRHGTLRAALDGTWELSSPAERRALAQLAVFSGGFTLDAAEDVLELGDERSLDVVGSLLDRSIVSGDPGARLGLLASVREYAREKLGEDREAEVRHGRAFARMGSQAALDALDMHGGAARLRALVAELDNLLAARRSAAVRGDQEVEVATLRAAWAAMSDRGPFEAAARLAAEVADSALADPRHRAQAQYVAAQASRLLGRMDEAVARDEVALTLYRELGDERPMGHVLGHLGGLALELGKADEARARYEEAIALARRVGDRRAEAMCLGNLGLLLRDRDADAARAAYEAALALATEVGDRRTEGAILGNLGSLLVWRGEVDAARACFGRALAVHAECGNRRSEGIVGANFGFLEHCSGRWDAARARYQDALAVAREVGERRLEAHLLGNLGSACCDQGDLEPAGAFLDAALAIHRELGNRPSEGITLGYLAGLWDRRGRPDEARACWERALALHREVRDARYEGVALQGLSAVEREAGRSSQAEAYARAALAIARTNRDRRNEGRALRSLGLALLDSGRPAEARSALTEGLAAAQEVSDRSGEASGRTGLARLADAEGLPDEADAHLAASEAVYRQEASRSSLAQVLCLRAAILWRRGASAEARAALSEAEAVAPPEDVRVRGELAGVRARIELSSVPETTSTTD